MSASNPSALEQTIRQAGEGWLIDGFAPPEKALEHLRQTLASVDRRARELLNGNAPDFSEAAIANEFAIHPQEVRAFFQALGGSRTPDMLLMVWRVLQGMEIHRIELGYVRQNEFRLQVELESPYGEAPETYTSTNVNDFTLLRHIGVHEIGGRPVFDGFYALKVRGV
jgi:hypothetical protein